MSFARLCSVAVLYLSGAALTFADHPVTGLQGGSSTAIITSSGKTAPQGSGAIGIQLQHVDFDNFSNQRLSELTDQDEDVHGTSSLQRISLDAAWGITDRLTAGVSIPFIKRNNLKETTHHGSSEEFELLGDAEGLGDLQLFGQYRLNRDPHASSHLSALFGLKLATGATREKSREGERLEVELQPGTGSTDPFAGLAVFTGWGRWNLDSNLLYTLSTEGSQDTALGDILNYNLALSTPLAAWQSPHQHTHDHEHAHWMDKITLLLELNGEWRERIEIDHQTEDNSGSNVIYLSPGLSMRSGHWVLSALAGWPIVDHLHGEQSEPEFRAVIRLTRRIGQ